VLCDQELVSDGLPAERVTVRARRLYHAFGVFGAIFRELECKTPIFSWRAVPKKLQNHRMQRPHLDSAMSASGCAFAQVWHLQKSKSFMPPYIFP
jgi:hypothetical protein